MNESSCECPPEVLRVAGFGVKAEVGGLGESSMLCLKCGRNQCYGGP